MDGRLRDINLLNAAVAMLSVMPDFFVHNGGLSLNTKSPEQKVGVS